MSIMHTSFKDIKIHTAKCDTCNKHNTSVMKQCTDCGQNFCTPCWLARGSDGTHMLNSGDIGYEATKARAMAKASRPRALDLLKPKKEKASLMKSPSPRLGGRSKRTRRRTVVIEESESEDDGPSSDRMILDEDDGTDAPRAEKSRKISAVRQGKQRLITSGDETSKKSTYTEVPEPRVKCPDLNTIQDEADAANSLLYMAAGSNEGPSNSFTPVNNTGSIYSAFPKIDLTPYGNRCETIYSPDTPAFANNQTLSSQGLIDQHAHAQSWYCKKPTNHSELPVAMRNHPYPTNPEVTSKHIGHDSEGVPSDNIQSHNTMTGNEHHNVSTTRDLSPSPNAFNQQDNEESLFIDPPEPVSGDEDDPMSALVSSAATTAMNDENWKAWLKKFGPQEDLDSTLSTMGDGMDQRGRRLFGNDAEGEVWNDEIFNEHYFDRPMEEVDGGRAVAKANLNVGSRAKKPRTKHHDASEEGEITEEDGTESG